MDTRHIGSLSVTVVGLGCNNFGTLDYTATERVVHAALDAGITLFDTADIYGHTESESFLGRALAGRWGEVVIATKFGMRVDAERQGARPGYVKQAVEDSLRRLRTDRIDLYQLHQPDPETPIADTLGALDDLVRVGKVREIGCSNVSVARLKEARAAVSAGAAAFASVQNEYSLLHREPEREVLAECERQGMAFIPFFPLACGLLTGKYIRGTRPPGNTRLSRSWAASLFLTDERWARADALREFAESRGHSPVELAISWLARNPVVVSVIAGATSPEQVRVNARAAAWPLTRAELDEIDKLAPIQKPASRGEFERLQ